MAFRRDKAIEAASKYAARGQHDKAAREYQAVVENDPKDIRSWLLLADCLVRSGQPVKAIDRYQQVARHYADDGHAQKALAVYRQILNLDPARLDVQVRCGQLFEQLRQIPDAVSTYERAAQAFLRGGNTRDAFSLYAKVADLEPTVVAKRLRLAELYSREQRVDEAVVEFYRAAVTLRDQGKRDEYIRVAERLLYHQKDHDEVQCDLIRAYLDIGEPRRALVKLNALLQRAPTDAKGLALLAEAFVALGKAEKAVSVILELVRDQRERGGSGPQTAHTVVRQALTWLPGEPRLKAVLGELVVTAQKAGEAADTPTATRQGGDADEEDEFDFAGDEIEELDAEELEEVDADAITEGEDIADADLDEGEYLDLGGDDSAEPPSLTREVMSDGGSTELPDAGDVDLDKQLEEIKVLLKYQLFEHALGHIEGVIESAGATAVTLEYRARTLAVLARGREAADDYVAVASLLFASDPTRARIMLDRALEHAPGHATALASRTRFSTEGTIAPASEERHEVGAFEPEGEDAEREAAIAAATDAFGDVDVDEHREERAGAPVPIPIPSVDTDVLDRSVGENGDESAAVPVGYSALESDGDLDMAGLDRAVPQTIGLDDGDGDGLGMDDPEFDDLEEALDLDEVSPAAGESGGFAISIHSEEEVVVEKEPIAVEDRFGLPDESGRGSRAELEAAVAAADRQVMEGGGHPVEAGEDLAGLDISEELEEIEFLVGQGFEDEALEAIEGVRERHPAHPGVLALAERLAIARAVSEAPTTIVRAGSGDASAPLLDVDDEDVEDDDYLAAIFDAKAAKGTVPKVQPRARAQVEGADAGTRFDLGMAYREMGLVDDAIKEFEAAAADPRWQARALVMMADMLTHQGRTTDAIAKLEQAAEAARTGDERSEANYELGVLYGNLGELDKAIARLEAVAAGYRDVDARLQEFRA